MTGAMYFTGRHGEQLGLTLVTEAHVPKSLARSAVAAAPSEPVARAGGAESTVIAAARPTSTPRHLNGSASRCRTCPCCGTTPAVTCERSTRRSSCASCPASAARRAKCCGRAGSRSGAPIHTFPSSWSSPAARSDSTCSSRPTQWRPRTKSSLRCRTSSRSTGARPRFASLSPSGTSTIATFDGQLGHEDVKARRAWRTSRGNKSVVVAVVDDGVDIDHPNLRSRIWRNPDRTDPDQRGRDFFIPDDNPDHFDARPKRFEFPFDDTVHNDIHGTCCAGVVAAAGADAWGVALALHDPPGQGLPRR